MNPFQLESVSKFIQPAKYYILLILLTLFFQYFQSFAVSFPVLVLMSLLVQNIGLYQLQCVLAGSAPYIVNSLIGYFAGGTTIYKVNNKNK